MAVIVGAAGRFERRHLLFAIGLADQKNASSRDGQRLRSGTANFDRVFRATSVLSAGETAPPRTPANGSPLLIFDFADELEVVAQVIEID